MLTFWDNYFFIFNLMTKGNRLTIYVFTHLNQLWCHLKMMFIVTSLPSSDQFLQLRVFHPCKTPPSFASKPGYLYRLVPESLIFYRCSSDVTMSLNYEPLIGLFFNRKSHLFGDQGQTLWGYFDSNFTVSQTISCCKTRNHMKPFFFCSVLLTSYILFLHHCFHFSYSHFKINNAQPWQHFIFIFFVWWSWWPCFTVSKSWKIWLMCYC